MFLWIRALTYMLLIGSGWLLVIPATILYWEQGEIWPQLMSLPIVIVGSTLFLTGTALALFAGYHLITVGRGTPFPLDPTRRLVTTGPYRYIRNPQGISMLMMTLALVISIKSTLLWVMVPLTLIYLELLVRPIEERQLARDYGSEYVAYKKQTGKWIPLRLTKRTAGERPLP